MNMNQAEPKIAVIYESMFGNTHEIASAIGRALVNAGDVTVAPLVEVPAATVPEFDVIIVGGPTHVHGLSRASSRNSAVAEAEGDINVELDESAPGPGLRDWLDELPDLGGVRGAAFDTRADKPAILVGSAARGISKRLKRRGLVQLVDPESFFVQGLSGPMLEGQEGRAVEWAGRLAGHILQHAT